jgi:hypothetical protein
MTNVRRMMMAASNVGVEPSPPGVWTQVGDTQTPTPVDMAGLTSSQAAFVISPFYLRTYNFDGTDWTQTGNSLTVTSADNIRIAALTSSRIAWMDTNGLALRAYDWDGTDWSLTGSGLSISNLSGGVARLSSSRVSICRSGAGSADITAYDFDGSSWSSVGSSLTLPSEITTPSTCALSSTRAVVMTATDGLTAYDFDGSNWTKTGSTTTIGSGGNDVARLSEDTVAVYYAIPGFSTQSYIIKYQFIGTGFSAIEASYSGITAAYGNRIASLATIGNDASRVVTAAGTATMRTFDFVLD